MAVVSDEQPVAVVVLRGPGLLGGQHFVHGLAVVEIVGSTQDMESRCACFTFGLESKFPRSPKAAPRLEEFPSSVLHTLRIAMNFRL